MHVELLFWDGCPSHPRALAELRAAMADLGLDPSTVAVREVDTHEQAARERFAGSPTIRIDGVDVQPTGDEPYGLACASTIAGTVGSPRPPIRPTCATRSGPGPAPRRPHDHPHPIERS